MGFNILFNFHNQAFYNLLKRLNCNCHKNKMIKVKSIKNYLILFKHS